MCLQAMLNQDQAPWLKREDWEQASILTALDRLISSCMAGQGE